MFKKYIREWGAARELGNARRDIRPQCNSTCMEERLVEISQFTVYL